MTEPKDAPGPVTDLYRRCEEALGRVRPLLEMDGGSVELVSVDEEDGIVCIRFQGACCGCPSSGMTLQMGIEHKLKASVPEVRRVVAV
jgi:Fe-S cluster biogenesis protein NfuA